MTENSSATLSLAHWAGMADVAPIRNDLAVLGSCRAPVIKIMAVPPRTRSPFSVV